MGKLKYVQGRIIVKVDLESKNSHTFEDGTKIRLERDYNNFNRRETQPVNAICVSASDVPEGSEILIGHNALHDTNKIFNHKPLSAEAIQDEFKYYSLPLEDCFAWRNDKGELQPMEGFAFGLRVFRPYKGVINGIEPELIKEVLYITTGELEGKVCHVLKASDYTIIFQGLDGREEQRIRCRHFENKKHEREEVICISDGLTEKVNNGELMIGISVKDAKYLVF